MRKSTTSMKYQNNVYKEVTLWKETAKNDNVHSNLKEFSYLVTIIHYSKPVSWALAVFVQSLIMVKINQNCCC